MKVASQHGNAEDLARATSAMHSLTRTIIYVVIAGSTGLPLNLDTISFWAHHMCYLAADMHIKFGIRDETWESDVERMIEYLRYFAPRYKLHGMSIVPVRLSLSCR